jgi:hypothetical protein
MERAEEKKELKDLDALPSIDDEVEFSEDQFTSRQLERFSVVRDQITALGSAGLTKELAKGQATQLCEAVKLVELKEEKGMSEEQFGRKLHKNVKSMFQFILGSVMFAIVEVNYPIDSYIESRNEAVAKLQEYLEKFGDENAVLHKPDPQFYEMRKRTEWPDQVRIKQTTRATRGNAKSTKAKSSDAKSADAVDAEAAEETPLSDAEEDKGAFELRIEREFVEAYKKWQADVAERSKSDGEKFRANRTIGKFTILLTILEGIRAAISTITSKIKAAVKDHEKVKQKLGCMVTLRATGESIANPLDNSNLAGLYEILKTEYAEATLVRFNSDLQLTMKLGITLEDMTKNPMKAVQKSDEMLATWQSMDYWNYMTPDIFFTNILLNSLPTSAFQRECVTEVSKYLEAKNTFGDYREDSSVVTTSVAAKGFPVYNFLRQYIKRCENSGNHGKQAISNTGNFRRQPYPLRNGNVETAAAALSGMEYTTEIGREKQATCKDTQSGKDYVYTATKEPCAKCNARGANPAEKHFPRCYTDTCLRCGLYGHKQHNCVQAQSTFVGKK